MRKPIYIGDIYIYIYIYIGYISDIFEFKNIGYFRYFQNRIFSTVFNITLLLDVVAGVLLFYCIVRRVS